jgi:hypothetical protein
MKPKSLTSLEIGNLIRAGKNFTVASKKDRHRVLVANRYVGANLTTRVKDDGSFDVIFIK